jgi:hypothetical protein
MYLKIFVSLITAIFFTLFFRAYVAPISYALLLSGLFVFLQLYFISVRNCFKMKNVCCLLSVEIFYIIIMLSLFYMINIELVFSFYIFLWMIFLTILIPIIMIPVYGFYIFSIVKLRQIFNCEQWDENCKGSIFWIIIIYIFGILYLLSVLSSS